MTIEYFKKQIISVIEAKGDATFATLMRIDKASGKYGMGIAEKNIIYWDLLDSDFILALKQLQDDGIVLAKQCQPIVYYADGIMLNMPLVKKDIAYKKPHWLPLIFTLKTP